MQVTKTLIALAVVAGFAGTSFAQGAATPAATAAPAAKVVAPAPAAADKKAEAPKAAEPVKAEAAKTTVAKDESKPVKMVKHHHQAKKVDKTETTPAAAPAPTSK